MVGAEAKKLFADAQAMLKRMVADKWLAANAVVGFWPANAVGDDIELYDERRAHCTARGPPYPAPADGRATASASRANTALADFVAPKETGLADYVGAFAVTTGIGEAEALARHVDKTDDYGRIMLKALADRLAEAFAERMHERVRRELWGYAPAEKLTAEELIAEKYRGIRPAPGYPAQPDHTEKATIFRLLDAEAKPASSSPKASPCGRALPCRGSTSPTPTATTSASARSSAIRSRTMPRARAGPSRRPSAGWRLCSTTMPGPRAMRPERGRFAEARMGWSDLLGSRPGSCAGRDACSLGGSQCCHVSSFWWCN